METTTALRQSEENMGDGIAAAPKEPFLYVTKLLRNNVLSPEILESTLVVVSVDPETAGALRKAHRAYDEATGNGVLSMVARGRLKSETEPLLSGRPPARITVIGAWAGEQAELAFRNRIIGEGWLMAKRVR